MSSKEKIINVGMFGAGRGAHLAQLLKEAGGDRICLKSVFDPNKEHAKNQMEKFGHTETTICDSFEEIVADPSIDWVMVMSPNAFHKEQVVASFEAGKNVFSEKPLATTIEDCQAMYDAYVKSGKLFATGFVLRYAPIYNKVKEILDSGKIGKILSIDANENIAPDHGSYIMCNWRRFTEISGPHILEKCVHDIDLLNWYVGALPSKVASFGGLDLFIPENKGLHEKYSKNGKNSPFDSTWPDPEKEECAFSAETDLIDNQVAIIQYRNNVRATFQATMSNAIPERRMYFSCTEGNLIVDLYSSTIQVKTVERDSVLESFKFTGDGHGGGDSVLMKALSDSMLNNETPRCGGNEGLESSVAALAIDRAREEGKVVDLEPIWKKLER